MENTHTTADLEEISSPVLGSDCVRVIRSKEP